MMLAEKQIQHAIASTLSVLVMLGTPTISHAMSCAPRQFTLSEAYEAADSIIVGLITECKNEVSTDAWANGGSDCSYSSMEVLKEATPARDYGGITSSSGCGLSLHVGGQYLLFLDSTNQPMHFSAPLSGNHHQTQLANQYLRIVRDFRDGRVNDLAEPWMYGEYMGQCSVYHSIRGNQISFYGRRPDAPQVPAPSWTQDSIDGQTVYRATVPFYDLDTKLPSGEGEIVAFGEVPDHNNDDLILRVGLWEKQPPPMRQATLSVGDKTWPLFRMETILSLSDVSKHKSVEYYAAGGVAKQILSAMLRPSDMVVSATIVATDSSYKVPEVTPPDQPSFGIASSKDDYFGPKAPEHSATKPSPAPKASAVNAYKAREEPPEPVLRVESRSTQLSSVIQMFEACYAGSQ